MTKPPVPWIFQIILINTSKTHNKKKNSPKPLLLSLTAHSTGNRALTKQHAEFDSFVDYDQSNLSPGHHFLFDHAKNKLTTLDHAPTTAKKSWPQGNHTLIQPDHSLTTTTMPLTTPVITRSLFNHAFVGGDTLRPRRDHNREIRSLFDFYPTIGRQGLTTPPVNRSRMDLPGTTAGLLRIS